MDKKRFQECIDKYQNEVTKYNIGTYQEKTMHKIIKNYYCENKEYQEVKINGCIADICKDKEIIEVQTRALNKLRDKLEIYPQDYLIKIVYPIPHIKYINWINPNTYEILETRKSPKLGKIYDSFKELYKIKMYLDKPNIKIILMLVDINEYRNLNGWSKDKKKGSVRENQVPIELIEEILINDYSIFIPSELPDFFTSNDYKKAIKTNINVARTGLNILTYLDVIEVDHKQGRNNVYKRKIKK